MNQYLQNIDYGKDLGKLLRLIETFTNLSYEILRTSLERKIYSFINYEILIDETNISTPIILIGIKAPKSFRINKSTKKNRNSIKSQGYSCYLTFMNYK